MCSGLSPTRSSRSWTFLRRSPRGATSVWIANGSPTMSPTVMRGLSEEYGSWNTIWMLRRIRRRSLPLAVTMSWPSNSAEPPVGFSSPQSRRATVDLPQPDSPTSPSVSPGYRSKETPSTALTAPIFFLNRMPRVSGKCLTMSLTCRTGSELVASFGIGRHLLLPEVARGRACGRHPIQRGLRVDPADVLRPVAPRVERAPRRDVREVRRQALDRVEDLALRVELRD